MAFKIFILSILLAAAYAGPNTSHKQDSDYDTRIIGGQDAQVGEFPYLVSLQRGNSPNAVSHFCGGSIIAKDWILTAAHCIREAMKDFSILIVKAGKHDLSRVEQYEQSRDVVQRIIHEQYAGQVKPYDISLLKLKTPLDLNQRVAIINLPQAGVEPSGQTTIAGWGSISRTQQAENPNILQKVQAPIMDRETCQQSLRANNVNSPLSSTNICTGTSGGGIGACQGDSGGPLISQSEVIGITSWVAMPCGVGLSVFTKVSDYVDWISNTMSGNGQGQTMNPENNGQNQGGFNNPGNNIPQQGGLQNPGNNWSQQGGFQNPGNNIPQQGGFQNPGNNWSQQGGFQNPFNNIFGQGKFANPGNNMLGQGGFQNPFNNIFGR